MRLEHPALPTRGPPPPTQQHKLKQQPEGGAPDKNRNRNRPPKPHRVTHRPDKPLKTRTNNPNKTWNKGAAPTAPPTASPGRTNICPRSCALSSAYAVTCGSKGGKKGEKGENLGGGGEEVWLRFDCQVRV